MQRALLLVIVLVSSVIIVQPMELAIDACPRVTVAAARDVWALRDAAAALEAAGKTSEADGCRALAVTQYGSEPVAHFDMGRLWQQRGLLEQATDAYEHSLLLDPAFTHAANNLGAVYKQLGRYAQAQQVLSKAIELDDNFAGLEYNLAMVLVKVGDEHRAVEHLQAALRKAKAPEPPPRWHDDLAAVLEALHRSSEALEQSTVAVTLEPSNTRFEQRLSRLRSAIGAGTESSASLRKSEAISVAGQLEVDGKASEAYTAYEKLAVAHPDDDDLLYRLAWNRYTQQDYYPAHEHLSAALELAPINRDYLAFMGVLLHETGNWEEAVGFLEKALASSKQTVDDMPSNEATTFENEEYEIWYNLGIVHKDLLNHQLAAKSFRKAYRLSAHLKRLVEASQEDVHSLKGERMKFLALAVEQYNKACDWRHLRELLPVLLKRLRAGDADALRATDPYDSLLYLNSAATSLRVAKQHVAAADTKRRDGHVVVPVTQYGDWLNLATSLRIGILSADMRSHPVAQTVLGVLQSIREYHGSHVHVVVFSMCPEKPDDQVQQAIRSQVDSWHDIHATTDEAAAQMVADEGIHVLVEMQGHTLHRRIGIALQRPAPLAISMQGFPASAGMSPETLPYILADKVVLPPELATPEVVSEEVMYMPFSFIACGYQNSLSIPVPQPSRKYETVPGRHRHMATSMAPQQRDDGSPTTVRLMQQRLSWVDVEGAWGQELDHLRLDAVVEQLQALLTRYPTLNTTTELSKAGLALLAEPAQEGQQGAVVNRTANLIRLCANNRAAKVDATAMTLWSNVLRRVHFQRQLWMDGQFQDSKSNLLMEAAARGMVNGVDAGRDTTYADYMQRLGECDLFLDTLTYGAHTVGLDALYMGLPIVTVAGGQMANRVGASMMAAVGIGLHVEPSLKAYEDAAVIHSNAHARQAKTGDRPREDRLSWEYRPLLPKPSRTSPLFDSSLYARDLVVAMQRAWEHHRIAGHEWSPGTGDPQ